jgi:hypothetical protein
MLWNGSRGNPNDGVIISKCVLKKFGEEYGLD